MDGNLDVIHKTRIKTPESYLSISRSKDFILGGGRKEEMGNSGDGGKQDNQNSMVLKGGEEGERG